MGLSIGFILPILIIYLLDLFNNKITQRTDITENSDAPIIAEISYDPSFNTMLIGNTRSVIAEQFRIFRSNLQFLLPKNNDDKLGKIILVTSSMSGEGKSFVSLNLASVISLSGKKVALLEFDCVN